MAQASKYKHVPKGDESNKTLTVALVLDRQFLSSRIRLLIVILNIVTQWCEYIDIIASNIPQMKIKAVSQWTARFNIQRKPEKCWCLLRNLSFGLFSHKKIPGLFQNVSKIPGLSKTLFKFQGFPGLSRTGGHHEYTERKKTRLQYIIYEFLEHKLATKTFVAFQLQEKQGLGCKLEK